MAWIALFVGVFIYYAGKEEFNYTSQYNGTLKPPLIHFSKGQDVDQFFLDNEKLFDKVNKELKKSKEANDE